MRNHALGYARVSTKKQTLDQQLDALAAAGCDPDRIYTDHGVSGAKSDRPGLNALLDFARPGDSITVTALDRMARSLSDLVRTVDLLREREINLRSLREGIDFSTATGRLQLALFGALAEWEKEMIKERAAAAREAAQARGRQVGRPRKLTDDQVKTARTLLAAGTDITSIASVLACSRATVYRVTAPVEVAS